MQSQAFLQNLCNYLIFIIDSEKKIEIQRQILSTVPLFEPYASFMRIDRQGKKYLTYDDLEAFLVDNMIRFSEASLREVIQLYDKDKDQAWNYEEFFRVVMTWKDSELRSSVAQRNTYYDTLLSLEIEKELSRLLRMELEFVEYCAIKREGLKYLIGYDVKRAFNEIDYVGDRSLDVNEFKAFFRKNGTLVSDEEIGMLIFRIGSQDGRVSFCDFQAIMPTINPIRTKMKYTTDIEYTSPRERLQKFSKPIDILTSIKSETKPNIDNTLLFSSFPSPLKGSYSDFMKSSNDFVPTNMSNYYKGIYNTSQVLDYSSILSRFLCGVVKLDSKLECQKENLALGLSKTISIMSIFKIFSDASNEGTVSLASFKNGLSYFDIFATNDEVKLVLKRYDLNMDNYLDYLEFCNMIIPRNEEYAKILKNRESPELDDIKRIIGQNKVLVYEVMKCLIDTESQIEYLRKKATDHPLFKCWEAFELIKGRLGNYSTKDDIESFMEGISTTLSDFEVFLLIERFDKNCDGKITMEEFMQEILPLL